MNKLNKKLVLLSFPLLFAAHSQANTHDVTVLDQLANAKNQVIEKVQFSSTFARFIGLTTVSRKGELVPSAGNGGGAEPGDDKPN